MPGSSSDRTTSVGQQHPQGDVPPLLDQLSVVSRYFLVCQLGSKGYDLLRLVQRKELLFHKLHGRNTDDHLLHDAIQKILLRVMDSGLPYLCLPPE